MDGDTKGGSVLQRHGGMDGVGGREGGRGKGEGEGGREVRREGGRMERRK